MMNFFNKDRCRRTRDRKATEAALLSAASKLFSQKGYENTRTLEIAKEAGVNEALILRYFGGKEGLLASIMTAQPGDESVSGSKLPCSQDVLVFPSKEEGLTLLDSIRHFFSEGRKKVNNREEFMRIACSRSIVNPEFAKIFRTRIIDEVLPVLQERIKSHFKGKKVKDEEIEVFAMLIASMNFSLNFMARKVHRISDKKVDLALEVVSKSLAGYFDGERS